MCTVMIITIAANVQTEVARIANHSSTSCSTLCLLVDCEQWYYLLLHDY